MELRTNGTLLILEDHFVSGVTEIEKTEGPFVYDDKIF